LKNIVESSQNINIQTLFKSSPLTLSESSIVEYEDIYFEVFNVHLNKFKSFLDITTSAMTIKESTICDGISRSHYKPGMELNTIRSGDPAVNIF
jgi:hypothetical protein